MSTSYNLLPPLSPVPSFGRQVRVMIKQKPLLWIFLLLIMLSTGLLLSSPLHGEPWGIGGPPGRLVDIQRCNELWTEKGGSASTEEAGWWTEDGGEPDYSRTSGGSGQLSVVEPTRKELLQELVSRTRGYFARDYSLWLGWNNIRYIIEAAILQADLLNRTLVIPSYVYSRACEFDQSTCAAFAKMVNKGDALDSDEWRDDPPEKQLAWVIPIELMLDLPLLQKSHPVITTADFLLLQDSPSPVNETRKGNWSPLYHPSLSMHEIPNAEFDTNRARVDRLPQNFRTATVEEMTEGLGKDVRELFSEEVVAVDLQEIVNQNEVLQDKGEDEVEALLNGVGAWVLGTYIGALGMDHTRTVTNPIKQIALGEHMLGWWNDYHNITEQVLYMGGELHNGRKPGTLRFTTRQSQDKFTSLVLYDLMPPSKLSVLSVRMEARMRERVGGRMWMGAHMRRGDFIKYSWAMNSDAYQHFDRIKGWMDTGVKTLQEIKESGQLETYDVPNSTIAQDFALYEPPQPGDVFYLATDERNATYLEYFGNNGAVFINNLMTPEDRRDMDAWSLVFTDVVGVLEQALLARSSFLYGHALSSVAGGAVNHRATLGKDPRTVVLD